MMSDSKTGTMDEQRYISNVKQISFSQQCVYSKLSDLNNLAVVRERLSDVEGRAKMQERVGESELEELSERLKDMTFDADSVTCNVPPVGKVALRIVERDEPKCIKFESVNSPVPAVLWIQLLPVTDTTCKMRLTLGARLNMFLKGMLDQPLREGIEKLADVLASIPYEETEPRK